MHKRTHAVMGPVATSKFLPGGNHIVTAVDIGGLIRRLILFEKAIVKTVRFKDLPALVHAFGESGLRELIKEGLLQFSCESINVVTDVQTNGLRHLPHCHFTFGVVQFNDTDGQIRKWFSSLRSISGLKNYQRALIEKAIWDSRALYSESFVPKLLGSIDHDARTVSPALRQGILNRLHQMTQKDVASYKLEVRVEETDSRIFRFETPLRMHFGLNEQQVHEIIRDGLQAVVNLNYQLANMQEFSALIGCAESESDLLYGKFAGVIASVNPEAAERDFKRVVELADLPDFTPNQKIDVEKLIKVRESDECRAFRDWLCEASSLSDDDIRGMTKGLKDKISALGSSAAGKSVRLAMTTLIGMIPGKGVVLGPVASALDTFVVDRALKRPAVVAFLSDLYPSLFSR